jgi:hypothetical protein
VYTTVWDEWSAKWQAWKGERRARSEALKRERRQKALQYWITEFRMGPREIEMGPSHHVAPRQTLVVESGSFIRTD